MSTVEDALRSMAGLDAARRAGWAEVYRLRSRVAELERQLTESSNDACLERHTFQWEDQGVQHWELPYVDTHDEEGDYPAWIHFAAVHHPDGSISATVAASSPDTDHLHDALQTASLKWDLESRSWIVTQDTVRF